MARANYRTGTQPAKPNRSLSLDPFSVKLDCLTLESIIVRMDTYAQRLGSLSADQERRPEELRRACADLLTEAVLPTYDATEERPLRTAAVGSPN